MIVLDTNVVSEAMRPSVHPAVARWFISLSGQSIGTTSVTVAEIADGLARLPDGHRKAGFVAQFEAILRDPNFHVLPLDEDAAREAGRLRAMRNAAGLGAPLPDMMIAGITLVAGASIATRNVRDFSGLPLTIVDPWAP